MSRDDFFYRYIYKRYDGYQILKDNEHYGWYPDLPTALFDRDRLEQCEWDMEVFVQLPEIPNPYEHMRLPKYNHDRKYITTIPQKYVVQRRINGKLINFGTFRNLEDARKRRDELITNGWCK